MNGLSNRLVPLSLKYMKSYCGQLLTISYLGRCDCPKWIHHVRLLHRHRIAGLKDKHRPDDSVRLGRSLLANDIRNKHSTDQMFHPVDFDQIDDTKQVPLSTLHFIRHLCRRLHSLILRCAASM